MRGMMRVMASSLCAMAMACGGEAPITPPVEPPGQPAQPPPGEPPAAPACAGSATVICPGESIAAKVDAAPEGTAFTLRPGIHRLQQFAPKAGQSFTGVPGAILSGARLLTDWVREGGLWVHGGQTQQGEVRLLASCQPAHPRCAYPEDLFIDDSVLEHVASLAAVRAGTWFFDYDADRVYMADDPPGRRVEIGVLPYAVFSNAAGVGIDHLTIEKYASPAQAGVIGFTGPGPDWVVRANDIRWNHGLGIRIGDGMQVLGNLIHEQRQLGLGGSGDHVLVQGNEIAFNNTAGFGAGPQSEAGATKFVATDGLIVRNNFSHHNHGPGLWTDIDNINTLYEDNRVEDNDWRGIFHEISYAAVIRGNIVRRNGFRLPGVGGAFEGSGILVSNSPDVEVVGNVVEDNLNGIMAREDDRGSGDHGPYDVVNLFVHENTVRQTDGGRAAGVTDTDPRANPYLRSANNRWVGNTYVVGPDTRFRWAPNRDVGRSEWEAAGQDSASVFR